MERIVALDATNIMYEHRRGLKRSGPPKLKTKGDCLASTGFISTYGYPKELQDLIKENKGTYGLTGMPVYSELLYIDIDDDKRVARDIDEKLRKLGIRYAVCESGSPDSFHFHIPIVPMLGPNIPAIHLQWVSEHFEGFDDSIYKTAGIIRIEGTYHKSYPGKTKQRVYGVDGVKLDLTNYKQKSEVAIPKFTLQEERDPEKLESLFNQMMFTRDYSDSRNGYIFKLAAIGADLGLSYNEVLEEVFIYNDLMIEPRLKEHEIMATVRSAYRGKV